MFANLHPVMKGLLVVMMVTGGISLMFLMFGVTTGLFVWLIQMAFWISLWLVLVAVSGFLFLMMIMPANLSKLLEALIYNVLVSCLGMVSGMSLVSAIALALGFGTAVPVVEIAFVAWFVCAAVAAFITYKRAVKEATR